MASSSLHQWESDPLFSAAEVVQDSADRMESLFRLLLHDQDLVQVDHPDPRLPSSIEYHKRDLATILETAKWQLEDFERAVSSLAMADKSRTREDVTSRHWQFIRAIKEQIYRVERSIEGLTVGNSTRNSDWVNLNEHDRDVLASFLTGGDATQHMNFQDKEDTSILRRFLDPTSASSLKGDEIAEYDEREYGNAKMNGDVHIDQYSDNVKENNLRKVGSRYDTRLGIDVINSPQERHRDDNWDVEANGAPPRSFFHENKLRAIYSRMNNASTFLNNIQSLFRTRIARNYTKRLKDGEEMRHSPTYDDASRSAKGRNVGLRNFQLLCSSFRTNVFHLGSRVAAGDPIFRCHVQVNQHSVQILLMAIITLIFLGILLIKIV